MKICCYDSMIGGLMKVICSHAKGKADITKIFDINDLKCLDSHQDYLLVNPGANFESWGALGEYARNNPDTKVVINAIGAFRKNKKDIERAVGDSENIEVLGFKEGVSKAHEILSELQ
ncbi:hypothetical protein K8R30_02325 [archaeon]|nr:hypothetical protein [archaeon]